MALTEQEKAERKAAQQKEVDENFKFFQKKLPHLERYHPGRYALLRKKKIIGVYDTLRDAHTTATILFKDKPFSIQKVDGTPGQFITYRLATREIA